MLTARRAWNEWTDRREEDGQAAISLVLILGMFLFRVVIHAARSRYDEVERDEDEEV